MSVATCICVCGVIFFGFIILFVRCKYCLMENRNGNYYFFFLTKRLQCGVLFAVFMQHKRGLKQNRSCLRIRVKSRWNGLRRSYEALLQFVNKRKSFKTKSYGILGRIVDFLEPCKLVLPKLVCASFYDYFGTYRFLYSLDLTASKSHPRKYINARNHCVRLRRMST